MYYLGVDIGGTAVKAGLIDETGRILETRRVPTVINDLDGFLSKLTELISSFQSSAAIEAIGIGVPGLLSSKTRVVEVAPNIPCLNKLNLEEAVADQVHMNVIAENDANTGAYGEFSSGAGRGARHMVYLTLGTGLGSGVIIDGKLYTGASGYAVEFGHTVIQPEGRPCSCGNRGCIETYVSATGMVATAREKGRPDFLTSELIYEAAGRGDETACAIFQETGRYLGIACSNLINTFNPDMIVIGGGVMACGDTLLRPTIVETRRRAFAPAYDACQIVQSRLWPDSGLIGAAMLARDRQSH